MVEEWKRAEILLEEIRKDVKAVAKGHSILDRKIDIRFNEVMERFRFIEMILKDHSTILKDHGTILKDHGTTLDEIKRDLREHIQQTAPPAHVPV